MIFKEGTHVFSSDGEDIGTVDRLILDPSTNEVSGIIVRKGWLFTEDKVVPIGLVDTATEERIRLRRSERALEELPEFEETYYVPLSEADFVNDSVTAPVGTAAPLYIYPPIGTPWWGYGSSFGNSPFGYMPDYAEQTQQNIPQGSVAVKEGARVLSRTGEHVGDIAEVMIDSQTNQATHVVISAGLLFKHHKLIPTNWIKSASEDDVTLTVNTSVVDRLPEY